MKKIVPVNQAIAKQTQLWWKQNKCDPFNSFSKGIRQSENDEAQRERERENSILDIIPSLFVYKPNWLLNLGWIL